MLIEYGDVVKPVNERVGIPFSQPYLIVVLRAVMFEQQIIIASTFPPSILFQLFWIFNESFKFD